MEVVMIDLTKPVLVVDIETNNLEGDIIWCIGYCDEFGRSHVAIPGTDGQEGIQKMFDQHTLVFHNAAFDVRVLRKHGYHIPEASYYDTMVMSYVWEPGMDGGHSLRAWGDRLKYPKGEHSDWSQLSDEMIAYCHRDCELTLEVFYHLKGKLHSDIKAWDLLYQVELPFIEVIIEMETTGFYFDNTTAESLLAQWSAARHTLEQENLSSILVPGEEKVYSNNRQVDSLASTITSHFVSPVMYNEDEWHKYADDIEEYTTKFAATKLGVIQFIRSALTVLKADDYRYNEAALLALSSTTDLRLSEIHKYIVRYYHRELFSLLFSSTTRNGVTTYNHCKLQEFNPNSGKHKQWLLYDKHKLTPPKYTESGQPSTDDESLSLLAGELPVAKTLSEIATSTKHIGMVQGYRERLEGRKLKGSFNQCITLTGRLSSTNPNLQNIPTRGDMGQEIRKLFHAPEDTGLSIVGIDLSNIEGRVLAHYLSKVEGDTRMADTFAAGVDFHQANADAWQVTRNEAKTLLYACLYGAGDTKLGNGDKNRGKELRDKLDKNMPALQRLKEKVWTTCRERGHIYTAFGRRLVYKGMQSNDRAEVARAKRQVFNAMLQGTAADVLKILVLGALRDVQAAGVVAWLIANVHDEALFYTYKEDATELCYILNERFEQPLLSHCPIEGTAKIGNTWYDVH
jgi:DNA polymerase I-like protein with 3'-5' exonuclease and polymerase domains